MASNGGSSVGPFTREAFERHQQHFAERSRARREEILRRALTEILEDDQARSDALRLDEIELLARLALEEAYGL